MFLEKLNTVKEMYTERLKKQETLFYWNIVISLQCAKENVHAEKVWWSDVLPFIDQTQLLW